MSDEPLDPMELAAIQAAIREAAPSTLTGPPLEATPMPLIAADREAQAARPRLADLAARWARRLSRALRAFVGDVSVDPMGVETIDVSALFDERRTMWTALLRTADRGGLVVGFGGDLVVAAAARRCGDASPKTQGREPSAATLRMFGPVGEASMSALAQAWAEIDRCTTTSGPGSEDEIARVLGTETVLAATIAVSGAASGRARIFVRPSVLAPLEPPTATVPANATTVAHALGAVPVELRVELGSRSLSLAELRALAPGTLLDLPVFVDDALPIYCSDVLKAWGRPVVHRGVLAVEIAALAVPGGARP